MAFKFTQKYRKQKYLLGALLLVILATGFIWWKGFYSPSEGSQEFSSTYQGKDINIRFDVLENEIFQELQPFLEISMPEKVGKTNPFFQSSPSIPETPEVEE